MSNVTKLTNIETGCTHHKDGSIEFHWVRPSITLGLYVGGMARQSGDIELIGWCEQAFGPQMSAQDSSGCWFYMAYKFYFLNEADAAMFVLRIS